MFDPILRKLATTIEACDRVDEVVIDKAEPVTYVLSEFTGVAEGCFLTIERDGGELLVRADLMLGEAEVNRLYARIFEPGMRDE